LIAGSAIIASVATFATVIPQAGAVIDANTPLQITAVGSDTTQNVMGAIMAATTTANTRYINVNAYISSNVVVPADDFCDGGVTFSPAAPGTPSANAQIAPAGSSAGRALLKNFASGSLKANTPSNSLACVDIARSSSFDPSSPNAGTGEYYAFALDAVSWATTSQNAPSSLTQAQLQGIYNCTYTDWSDVGGTAGPIQRYLPKYGLSGTRDFFVEEVLALAKNTTFTSNANCPAVKDEVSTGVNYEENTANLIPKADYNKAIFPYSGGVWSYQAANSTNPTIDKRSRTGSGVKARIGGMNRSEFTLTGAGDTKLKNGNIVAWNTGDGAWQLNTPGLVNVSGNSTDPAGYLVNEMYAKTPGSGASGASGYTSPVTAANAVLGVRFVYNVLDTRIGATSLAGARALVGFDNVASNGTYNSPLCNGDFENTILSNGFAALPFSTGGNANVAGKACRKFSI